MSTGVVVIVRGTTLPGAALKILRDAGAVYAATDVDPAAFGVPAVIEAPSLKDVVLLAGSRDEPAASLLIATGAEVIETPVPPLVEAAEVMDRLRSPGGCPWDAVQTHDSLRQYLVEETYELLDAIEEGDREALREELGDVLLQVLFHARVAAEDAEDPFGIDDVAAALVAKLVGRHPHVFADADKVHTVEHQNLKWEELKQREKQRRSIVDGVALGQPAVYSSRYIEDGSFVRLQNVTIGYTLNIRRATSARFYVSGDNLLLGTHYSGLDPEVFTDAGLASRGIDYLTYPRARTFTGGVRLGF